MDKTAKHLPLSLGVQAALVVQALPTQEECDMLQLRVPELTEAVHSLTVQSKKTKKKNPEKMWHPAVYQVRLDCQSLAVSN